VADPIGLVEGNNATRPDERCHLGNDLLGLRHVYEDEAGRLGLDNFQKGQATASITQPVRSGTQ
jgi:hypothetical protein